MNRGEIRESAIARLREQTTPIGWTVDELNRYIDDGYQEIALKTRAVVATRQLSLTAGQVYVTLPTDVIAPLEFKDDNTGLPIDPVDWEWVDQRDCHWIRWTRSRPSYVFSFGTHELGFYPAYVSDSTVTYSASICPAPITQDATEPELPDDYHYALVHYTLHRAILKDANTPDRLQRALRQYRYFQEGLGDLEDWSLKRLANFDTRIFGSRVRTPSSITEES